MSIIEAVPRKAWTLTKPGGDIQHPIRPTLFVHYSDSSGRNISSFLEQRAVIQAIRNYHVESNGWLDIGYSYIITQPWGTRRGRVRVWTGRGRHRVPSAQLHFNQGNLAVCVIADQNDRIAHRTVLAIAELARKLNAREIRGHRDVNDTDCPGDALYAKLPEIRKLAGL